MRFYLIVFIILTLNYGCTISQINKEQEPLNQLEKYLETKDKSSLYLLRNYWASKYVIEGEQVLSDNKESNKIKRNTIDFLVRFNDQIHSVTYKKQSIKLDQACVLITGKNNVGELLAMNIPYVFEGGNWLISGEIKIDYPDKGMVLPVLQSDCKITR